MTARVLGKALLWAITAAIATALVFEALVVALALLVTLGQGPFLSAWVGYGFSATLEQLVTVLGIQLPLTFLMSCLWLLVVRRQPARDQTRQGFLIGCLIVSLPTTLSFWMLATSVYNRAPSAESAISITISELMTMILVYLGVLLPRLVVPGLKQGQLIPPLGDTAQEPVR
ncbi:MAG: hypothetical protein ACXU9O_12445 [Gemmatimonadaceae bacterium]